MKNIEINNNIYNIVINNTSNTLKIKDKVKTISTSKVDSEAKTTLDSINDNLNINSSSIINSLEKLNNCKYSSAKTNLFNVNSSKIKVKEMLDKYSSRKIKTSSFCVKYNNNTKANYSKSIKTGSSNNVNFLYNKFKIKDLQNSKKSKSSNFDSAYFSTKNSLNNYFNKSNHHNKNIKSTNKFCSLKKRNLSCNDVKNYKLFKTISNSCNNLKRRNTDIISLKANYLKLNNIINKTCIFSTNNSKSNLYKLNNSTTKALKNIKKVKSTYKINKPYNTANLDNNKNSKMVKLFLNNKANTEDIKLINRNFKNSNSEVNVNTKSPDTDRINDRINNSQLSGKILLHKNIEDNMKYLDNNSKIILNNCKSDYNIRKKSYEYKNKVDTSTNSLKKINPKIRLDKFGNKIDKFNKCHKICFADEFKKNITLTKKVTSYSKISRALNKRYPIVEEDGFFCNIF